MRTFVQKPKTTQQTASAKSTIPGRAHFGQSPKVSSILQSQRTIGNQAVLRMLQPHTEDLNGGLPATVSPRFGHDFSQIPIHPPAEGAMQTKLAINKSEDEYAHEADRVIQRRTLGLAGSCWFENCETQLQNFFMIPEDVWEFG